MSDTPDCIIRIKAVLARTGLSRSTMYRKISNGTFPAPIRISERCVGWRESAVMAWQKDPRLFPAHDAPLHGSRR